MRQPIIRTRLTTSSDQTVDVDPYVNDNKVSADQKVMCLKTMIMRKLSESQIADNNIPTILNSIPDSIYVSVLCYSGGEYQNNVKILANAISAICGMYRIEGITVHFMINIINSSIK